PACLPRGPGAESAVAAQPRSCLPRCGEMDETFGAVEASELGVSPVGVVRSGGEAERGPGDGDVWGAQRAEVVGPTLRVVLDVPGVRIEHSAQRLSEPGDHPLEQLCEGLRLRRCGWQAGSQE